MDSGKKGPSSFMWGAHAIVRHLAELFDGVHLKEVVSLPEIVQPQRCPTEMPGIELV